jgi:HK97 family phage portal protein
MAFLDKLAARGRRPHAPPRDTKSFPMFAPFGQGRNGSRLVWKPTPRNLRYFATTPYARRAINAIKNPIAQMPFEIAPKADVDLSAELQRQIEVATYCLAHPNAEDSFETLTQAVIEDVLIGAGAIEKRLSGDKLRPIWLYPVDGLSIQIYPGWAGGRNEARYAQSVGYGTYTGGGPAVDLTDDELIYIRPNPSTATPFGLGPLEVAFNSISRQLAVGEFAGNLTGNARPAVMLDMGEMGESDKGLLEAFRNYWSAEIEGQGKMPIVATKGGAVHRLYPDGDGALYLKYQEFLKVEIATAFDLSPQNLGVERDVNRNTSEVAEERDWVQAIRPRAREYAAYLTHHVLHRALGFHGLEFRFVGLDREDEEQQAKIGEIEWRFGAITPDEYRAKRGRAPSDSPFAAMTGLDFQIAKAAATGAKRVFDPALPTENRAPAGANPEE